MDAFQILVIVLSIMLAIFLTISIVVTVHIYKLVKSLREVATKGGAIVDRVEEIGEAFAKNAGAAGLMKMLIKFIAKSKK